MREDFTGASNGDLLKFNGAKWVKATLDYSATDAFHYAFTFDYPINVAKTTTIVYLLFGIFNYLTAKRSTGEHER